MAKLAIHDYAVLNLRIFVLRQDVPRYQLVRTGVGALGDDPVGLWGADPGQGRQVVFGRLVQVHRSFVAEPLFDAFGNSLGVAFDIGSGFGRFLAELVRR